uniref:Uncharacterized protein LOC104225621 n=1 Tax=Nicotiana sylvestris TaxID=4096 RepID=A0A1U7WEU2_NICSY|nr:PREDICTED: uncharacterized protein LOC104225621 [Nicotiana sylvestris]
MLEALMKRVGSGENKIEANEKKVETYNSRVNRILGAPPILKGLDSKKFIQKPFLPSAAPKPIQKRFCMHDIPIYNGTTDSNEHVTSYKCAIKGNALEDDEIESVLLKKFGETLSKGAMIWYHNLPPNSIDFFAMLADAFVKAHAGAIKVKTKKSYLFKVKQRDNRILREFASMFQMERMDLPPVVDDWAIQECTTPSSQAGLELAKRLEAEVIEAYDSLLVVNKVKGTFEVKEEQMQRNKYIDYSKTKKLPSDPKESRALRTKAARFILVEGALFRRTFDGPLTKCLRPGETEYALRDVHEGTCKNHSGAESLVRKLIRAGYYWNKMEKDAKDLICKCDDC